MQPAVQNQPVETRPFVGVSIASFSDIAPGDPGRLFEGIVEIARAVDRANLDLLAVPDHVVQMSIGGGAEAPMLEAYTLLGALAAHTGKVRLGAFVTPVTFRNPAVLAKTVTTLDVISNGRAVLGLGAGVNSAEHAAYGISFPSLSERVSWLADALGICRAMFDGQRTLHGAHFRIQDAVNSPQPLQHRVPILVGGGGERSTLPLAAEHGDMVNLPPADDSVLAHKLEVLRRMAATSGRAPEEIRCTAFVTQPESGNDLVHTLRRLIGLGLDGVIIAAASPTVEAIQEWSDALTTEYGSA